jgi:deoxyadenosine/deoxycytidine kinase
MTTTTIMIISIDGNISSGKSTVLSRLADAVPEHTYHPEPVNTWTFLEPFYKDKRTYALPLSLQVLASFSDITSDDTVVITERSPLTNRDVFTKMHVNDGTMDDEQWQVYKKYYDVLGWTPDAIVFVQCPAAMCHDRMHTRSRACETGVDLEYLERLEKSYETLLRFAHVPIAYVDGTQDTDSVVHDVRSAISRFTRLGRTG